MANKMRNWTEDPKGVPRGFQVELAESSVEEALSMPVVETAGLCPFDVMTECPHKTDQWEFPCGSCPELLSE